ncbi:hypothetical protein [Streptococcus agalactiae]|uniref:Uncharacterized protein n=1 Tax=Streptococcus agalactiae MRI Z1-216 TaxID=1154879 RepID=A0AAD3A3E7_STRAG|nr:hypothetical protein [Streptococcus agalactiae]HEL0816010.1 hypothetical protein [Streptococcus equi subsp. zooepidemicus]EPU31295.1 hypothetical protein SAG0161_00965 [Streptococcus agalactiae MRI Z1-213]EPU38341.1 hypothetical protein SAG0164_01840 [Streptococcus agalactiae MRI Z1-216]EPU39202.1 hypothetical protein SAG0162_10265 [Streptococcus agalactiae MRI Z1-214]EPX07425.1 hypothetical protein SAG0165_04980 [Streptococcus agalactiae MRI Z1-217]
MAFIPFKKSNKCLVTDDLFLEVTWEEGKSPEDDSELLGIIEGLDQQYLDFDHTIEESLPYVTFYQAELLFQALKDAYGHMELKKVAICHLEGKEAISEGEVFANPFVIDQRYQNLLLPLIQSIMTGSDFQTYTYQEKREYFVNQIYPAYKASLGIQESALPLFPEEGEQVLALFTQQQQVPNINVGATPQAVVNVADQKSLKKVYLLMGLLATLAIGGIVSSVIAYTQLTKQNEQVTYLYQELKNTQNVINEEHQIDVFSRYFLPNYYSGKKENLEEFLSDGDAKYTVPKEGTLQSVILEQLTYEPETKEYQPTYVLSVKEGDKARSIRLSFTAKKSDSAKYGFVVTTEPKEADYIK